MKRMRAKEMVGGCSWRGEGMGILAIQKNVTQGWVNGRTRSLVNCARVPPKDSRQQFPDLRMGH